MKANLRLRSLRTNLRDPRSGPCFRAKGGDRVRDRSSPSRARGDPPADREGSGRRPCARKPPRDGRDLTGARGEGARRLRKRGQAPFGRGKAPVRGQNVPCYGRQSSLLRDRNLLLFLPHPGCALAPFPQTGPALFVKKRPNGSLNPHRGQRLTFFLFQKQIFVLESIFGKARSRTSVQSQKMFAMVILWPLRGASI